MKRLDLNGNWTQRAHSQLLYASSSTAGVQLVSECCSKVQCIQEALVKKEEQI
jgi:hypothetical protein